MLPRSENPAEGQRSASAEEPASQAASSAATEEAPETVDEVDLECQVCHKTIPAGDEYTVADYGPVHTEPCSHQAKELGDDETGVL